MVSLRLQGVYGTMTGTAGIVSGNIGNLPVAE
jgi:hypothetical protein